MKAPAKINVCLFLGPTRPSDGRHELVTVFQPVELADEVTLDVGLHGRDTVVCPGVDGPNLALTAIDLFRARTGFDGPPVTLTIQKRIPVAGGMAGGSADAAAALRLLQGHSGLGTEQQLHEIAFALGADVPAQIRPARYLASGAGEQLEPLPAVAPYGVLIVPSPQGLSTGAVFQEADRLGLPRKRLDGALDAVRHGLPELPDELIVNELQPAALSLRRDLKDTLETIRQSGADHALVSGSGPTCLGLFKDPTAAVAASSAWEGTIAVRTRK